MKKRGKKAKKEKAENEAENGTKLKTEEKERTSGIRRAEC